MIKSSRGLREDFFIIQLITRLQRGKYFSKHELVRKIFFVDKVLQLQLIFAPYPLKRDRVIFAFFGCNIICARVNVHIFIVILIICNCNKKPCKGKSPA